MVIVKKVKGIPVIVHKLSKTRKQFDRCPNVPKTPNFKLLSLLITVSICLSKQHFRPWIFFQRRENSREFEIRLFQNLLRWIFPNGFSIFRMISLSSCLFSDQFPLQDLRFKAPSVRLRWGLVWILCHFRHLNGFPLKSKEFLDFHENILNGFFSDSVVAFRNLAESSLPFKEFRLFFYWKSKYCFVISCEYSCWVL